MTTFRTLRATAAVAAALALGGLLAGCTPGNTPDGVPGRVSVVPGTVGNLVKDTDSNWSFSVKVNDTATQKDAVTKLKDSGFRVVGTNERDGATTTALTDDTYNVTVLAKKDSAGKPLVVYNIVKIG